MTSAGFVSRVGVALLAVTAVTAAEDPALRKAAERFYEVHRASAPSGVPEGKALDAYRPVMSASLVALLERAGAAERAYATKTNHESPPLLEGDAFTSTFEGASEARVESCTATTTTASCRVALVYRDEDGDKPIEWTDTVHLVKESGSWRVADIAYGASWEFGHRGRLTELLMSVIKDSQEQ